MNPILKYRGGKSKEISKFEKYIPADYETYIEPFLGGASVFFYLEPEKAILNDLNEKLIRFYTQLRDNYSDMRLQLDELQSIYEKNQKEFNLEKLNNPDLYIDNKNEKLYYEMRKKFNYPDNTLLEGVVYFFINKIAYSGMIRYNSSREYNVPFGRYTNFNTKLVTLNHSLLLKKAEIFNLDYKEIFDMAKPNDFIFLDPPYDCVFHDYGNIDMMNGFDEEQHIRLANDFKNLKCKALMIIGKTDLTERLYKEFIVDEYYKNYAVNIKNRFTNGSIHLVIKNY